MKRLLILVFIMVAVLTNMAAANTTPTTKIMAHPDKVTSATKATFKFESNVPDSTFECGLDGSNLKPCVSPHSYSSLRSGSHVFRVRAIDATLSRGPVSSFGWSIEPPLFCDSNNAVFMIKCFSHKPGIQVDTARALRIAKCESGVGRVSQTRSSYYGVFQLLPAEFTSFSHQGPSWVDAEFRQYHYSIMNNRGNILATFSHVHRYGWGFIGVCD